MTKDTDLLKRLRMADEYLPLGHDGWEAADRIEALEAELHLMKTSGVAEVAVRNPSVMEYMKHWEGRAEAAEAKLAKAVEALKEAWFMLTVPHLDYEPEPEEPGLRRIKTTLAELKGDKP